MSETAPLIDTKERPIGPKTSDYVKVILWPVLLALCFIALFVFVMVVPPTKTINFYSVAALATMLLPVIPVLSALVFAKTSVCDCCFFAEGREAVQQTQTRHTTARAHASPHTHTHTFEPFHSDCFCDHHHRARAPATRTSGSLLQCARWWRA